MKEICLEVIPNPSPCVHRTQANNFMSLSWQQN